MRIEEDDVLLRVFISEGARRGGRPVYEDIVLKARELGIAGATVLRGMLGYGASAHLHAAKLVDLSASLPVVVEIIDREEKLEAILPFIDEVVADGFVTLEKVHVIKYRR